MVIRFLLLFMFAGTLLGCQQQADENIKEKIQFVQNENYLGDPNPTVKEDMKLTDEERKEFEKVKQEILDEKKENKR